MHDCPFFRAHHAERKNDLKNLFGSSNRVPILVIISPISSEPELPNRFSRLVFYALHDKNEKTGKSCKKL